MQQPDHAHRRLVKTRDAVEHRGLARAVGPDERGDLAAPCGKTEIVDRDQAAEAHRQMLNYKNGFSVIAHRRPCSMTPISPCPPQATARAYAWRSDRAAARS